MARPIQVGQINPLGIHPYLIKLTFKKHSDLFDSLKIHGATIDIYSFLKQLDGRVIIFMNK
jgi:hypothetical protein